MDTTMLRALSFLLVLILAPILNASEPDLLKPINLEKLNTPADEDDPCIAPDNLALFYATNPQGTSDIHVSRRAANQLWPAGKPIPGLANKDADERSPFLFKITLYFATNWVPDEKLKDQKNFDIKHRTADRAPLILPGISEAEDELHPWITPAGKEFYFSRKTKEGWILFMADGPVPGPIGMPKSVGFDPGFHHATLTNTGLTMYLQGPLENNRWGLFRSKRAKVGAAWSKPEPLENLNHPKGPRGDLSPSLSPDGARLYFASDRPEGKGNLDLWYILTSQLK
jgi:hypothetical protein